MKTNLRRFILVAVVITSLTQIGCGPRGFAAFRTVAAFAAIATVLAVHDAHFHSHHCGHEYVYVDERPVYHYEDRWEYYDSESGHWYYYEGRPQ